MPIDPNAIQPATVKEISMVSHYFPKDGATGSYRDLLRVSPHWTSYKRTRLNAESVTDEWSYKTTREDRDNDWNRLVYLVLELFQDAAKNRFPRLEDSKGFNVRLALDDGRHLDVEFIGDFRANGIERIARSLKLLIPSEETSYPDVLDIIPLRLKPVAITPEVLKSIDKNSLSAFMYAEYGAMGAPGEFVALDEGGTKFYIDSVYGKKEGQVSQEEAIDALFPVLKPRKPSAILELDAVMIDGRLWIFSYLGMGNHLYMTYEFWTEHWPKIFALHPVDRYKKWKRLVFTPKN